MNDEIIKHVISQAIGTMRYQLMIPLKDIVTEFNEYNELRENSFTVSSNDLSRLHNHQNNASKLLAIWKRPIVCEFLVNRLQESGYYWNHQESKFTDKRSFESELFDRIRGNYNIIGIDQDGKSLFVTRISLMQDDFLETSKFMRIYFLYGGEEQEETAELEIWKQHCHFTLKHDIFPMSGFFRVNMAPKPQIILGVHWSVNENTLQPFSSPFIIERITDSTPPRSLGRSIPFDQFQETKISNFLQALGGTFSLPVQEYYDMRDLGD